MPTSNWYQMTWRIGLLVNLIPIDRDLVYGMNLQLRSLGGASDSKVATQHAMREILKRMK